MFRVNNKNSRTTSMTHFVMFRYSGVLKRVQILFAQASLGPFGTAQIPKRRINTD